MTPLISVIISTFNRKDLVLEAITSVLAQEPKNYEIIVVDDGSTDGTADFLTSLKLPIEIISQENSGVANARNRGIKEARGQYLAFLDSDDLWLPGILKTQLEYLSSHPNAPLVYVDQHIEIKGKRIKATRFTMKNFTHEEMSKFDLPTFARSYPIHISSVMARSNLFREVGYFNENLKMHEDTDMWNRISEKYNIGYIKAPLVIFRREIDNKHLNNLGGRKISTSEGKKYINLYKERKADKLTPREVTAVEAVLKRIQKLETFIEAYEKGKITEREFRKKIHELAWEE